MPDRPSEILERNRAVIRQIVARYRATNPRVFGSAAQRSDTPRSDLDLIVDPLPGATLFDLGAMQVDLEDALGVPVDLLTPGDLPPRYRSRVLDRAVPV